MDNLRCPGGRVPDPNPAAQAGSTIPTPPFVFGAKTQRRIAVACDLVKYYRTVGHDLTAADRIPSTTPGAEPPRDVKDSGSARSHPTHLETSSSNRP